MADTMLKEGAPVYDPGGDEIGRVESVVRDTSKGDALLEVRVALEQHIIGREDAPTDSRLLRVPGADINEREGRLVLNESWDSYRGPPSPPLL